VLVHLAGKHPAKLQTLDLLGDVLELRSEIDEGLLVGLLARKLVELGRLGQRALEAGERIDYGLERRALAAEILRALLIRPDVLVLELAIDFLEPLAFLIIVKDTSGGRRSAP
jgi:hypothetical protein